MPISSTEIEQIISVYQKALKAKDFDYAYVNRHILDMRGIELLHGVQGVKWTRNGWSSEDRKCQ